MSLLEDIYLEEDDGANDLERIIEGDDLENNLVRSDESDDGGNKSDEAEEDKRRVDPKQPKEKRVAKNPRFMLNPARLTGPRGIQTIQEHFKDFKFKGKGHEQEDLDLLLKKLEHWAHRLYPKFQFDDCLEKIEVLGRKRQVVTHVKKIRQDMLDSDIPVAQHDSSDDEATAAVEPPPMDEFDQLLEQQIAIARSTPASVRPGSKAEQTPHGDHGNSTPRRSMDNTFAFTPTNSTPVSNINTSIQKPNPAGGLTEEQKGRMLRNRQIAEQKRLERQRLQQQGSNSLRQKDTSQTHQYDISKDFDRNKSNDEIHCLRTEGDIDVMIIDENKKHTGNNSQNKIESDEDITVIDVDGIQIEKDTIHRKNNRDNLNGIEIELTSDGDDEIEKVKNKVVEEIGDEEMTIGLQETDAEAKEEEIESHSIEENIEKEIGDEEMTICSEDRDEDIHEKTMTNDRILKKQNTETVGELGDEEVSMSLEYKDDNSTDAS